jgi:hypothetical protein
MAKYWAYENSKNNGHRIRIHKEGCRHCMFEGQEGPILLGPGRIWHGPFEELDTVIAFAEKTGAKISQCGVCFGKKL